MSRSTVWLASTFTLVGGLASASAQEDPCAAPDAVPAAEEPAAPDDAVEPAPSAEPVAASAEPSWADKVTLAGLVDGFLSIPFQGELTDPSRLRVFDGANGSFTLAYAELAVSMPAAPAGFRVDLGFGPVADLTSLETITAGTPPVTVTGPSEVNKHVQQAYASFKLPGSRAIVVDAGKFVTTAGSEVIEAKDNWLYTRSILFGYAIPFTHTGVRLTAAMNDQLTLQAMVVNGWDVGFDNNKDKTFGASALYAGNGLTGAANVLVGKDGSDVRVLADLVVGKKLGDKLALNLNVDFGKEGDASWYGAAAMLRATVSRSLSLTARGEHFQDPDGARAGVADGAFTEVTVGAGVPIGGNGELRFEGRVDLASDDVFDGGSSSTQATATAATLAWF